LRECYDSLKKQKQVLIIKNVNHSEFAILNNKTALCVKNDRVRRRFFTAILSAEKGTACVSIFRQPDFSICVKLSVSESSQKGNCA